MEEKTFDGIILPLYFTSISGRGIGEILGITVRELGLGPKELKMNYAVPKPKELSNMGLFWLEGCDEDPQEPYSERACYYWVIQCFSKSPAFEKTAIRAKPTGELEKGKVPYFNHDFIFWYNGKPVSIGHQYIYGRYITRRNIGEKHILYDVIKAWQEENYNLEQSRNIQKIKEALQFHSPYSKILNAEKEVKTDARNASWPSTSALMAQYV